MKREEMREGRSEGVAGGLGRQRGRDGGTE